jgi:serine/threonine-protein kinase RsbW
MLDNPESLKSRIVIHSDPRLIREVDEFVESRLRRLGLEDSTIADIAICATEIVNNAIEHGNKEDPEKKVVLEMDRVADEIIITISDQGTFFDPENIQDPVAEENLLREVGRGIFIVRQLMDSVKIRQGENGGTVVTFSKKIA